MNLNKLDNKNKIIALILIFLVYAILVLYLIIFKSITNIKSTRADILDQKINLEKNLIRDKNMAVLAKQLEMIEPKLDEFDQIFINSNRELEFITTLENIAGDSQISQKIILDPDSGNKKNIYKKTPLKLSVKGNFKNIMNYLAKLEALNYYINIKSLVMSKNSSSRPDAGPLQNIINLEISADTFWK